jgi:carbon-monoxide dehydrogenase large subunit
MIGQPIPRLEDERLITGQGQYTDDIKIEAQVHAYFVRSEHAHARIIAIDTFEASASPGVLAVLTGDDYLAQGYQGIQHVPNPADAVDSSKPSFSIQKNPHYFVNLHLPLASGAVRHVGEAVVMVIADTVVHAKNAAELVRIDYETLTAVVKADDALENTAAQLWEKVPHNLCHQETFGDDALVDQALARADVVIERRFVNSRIVNAQMEPRAAIGLYDPDKKCWTLISGSQGVNKQKQCLLDALKLKDEQIRVICPDVGGGFGPRTMLYPEQLAVVWGAMVVKRSVKWRGERSEGFVSDYQGRDQIITSKMGFDRQGKIVAVKNHWIANLGAHAVSFVPPSNGMRIMTTVYDIPLASVLVQLVYTNTVPTGPYRGAGRPESHHVMERMLDIAADELKLDRLHIREVNLIQHHQLPYRSPMGLSYDSGSFASNMRQAVEMAHWADFPERQKVSLASGKLRGIGLANYVEAPVGAPIERIRLTVNRDGQLEFITGTQSQGQGHETTFRQVLSHFLGFPLGDILFQSGDTDFVTKGGGTHSDRSLRIVSSLIKTASEALIAQGKAIFASLNQVPVEDVAWSAFHFSSPQPSTPMGLGEMAKLVHSSAFDAQTIKGELGPNTPWLQVTSDFKGRIPAHPTGCAVCELEIDPSTGEVDLLNYTSLDDVGQVINPLIVDGQLHGGLAQGIGQALSEGYYFDAQSAQVLSGSFMDYGMPRAGSIPPLRIAFTEDPTKLNPLRVKGGGESGITPATACIFNALAHAMSSNAREEIPMPATASVLWHYLQALKEPHVQR